MRTRFSILLIALLAAMSGCSVMPSRVVMPAQAAGVAPAAPGAAANGPSYAELLKPVEEYTGVRPKEVEISRLRDQLTLYIGTWRKHSSDLLAGRDLSDNGVFWGTVIAGVQAVRDKVQDAKRAAAGVGLLTLVQDKYKTEAQATNYSNAALAMVCIRKEVEEIHPIAWQEYFDPTSGKTVLDSKSGAGDTDALAQLDRVFDDINEAMGQIAHRLRSLQESQRIGTTSVADIKAMLEQAKTDAQQVQSLGNASLKVASAKHALRANRDAAVNNGVTARADVVKSLLELKGKTATCAKLFGSTS